MGLNRTPLFAEHQRLGARLIDFGGWEMPVQYTSIVEEHLAVRNAAGIFDISHMGEVTASGAAVADFLNCVLTNDVRKLAPGEGQYTLMCNERGGTIDDLYAYRLSEQIYLLIVNAARTGADVAWLQARAAEVSGELKLTDASHNYSAVAVQGPRVKEFINAVVPSASVSARRVNAVTDLKKNEIGIFPFERIGVLVSRTGYTGEDGFEIAGPDDAIRRIWDKNLTIGRRLASNRAASARATRCARRLPIRSTATNWTKTPHRLKPDWGPLSRSTKVNLSDVLFSPNKRRMVRKKNWWRSEWAKNPRRRGHTIRSAPTASVSASSPAAPKARRSASALVWAMCRLNWPSRKRGLKSKFAANARPPLSYPSRFTGSEDTDLTD